MSSRRMCSLVVSLLFLAPAPVAAGPVLIPPVDGPVVVHFVQPQHAWGPGHRGIDYAVAPGTEVRAAGAGTVIFAGDVAGHLALTIRHGGGYESTYTSLGEISIEAGETVSPGQWIATSEGAHPNGEPGLHFGVKIDGAYVDPEGVLGEFDMSHAIHLAPLVWQPPREMPLAFRSAFADAGTAERLCRRAVALRSTPEVSPNDNVAVAIAGIGSSTRDGISADMYEHGPEELGYPQDRTYRFSYAGPEGADLHRPYSSTDTFGDIAGAAQQLRTTLREIARLHPGSKVDLIAHSMGGLVARRFLADEAGERGLPQVEHLVTFATPHEGSSIASIPGALRTKTLTGGLLIEGVSALANAGGPVPDPRSAAVSQLSPGSAFLEELGRESVVYGTRVLALGIANDIVVTADRAQWDGELSRTVGPSGLMGHSSIVSSDEAQGLAYAFLRDAPPSCETAWDLWGPRLGRATGLAEENSYRALVAVEELALGRALRVGKLVDRYTSGRLGWAARKIAGKLVHRTGVRAVSGFR